MQCDCSTPVKNRCRKATTNFVLKGIGKTTGNNRKRDIKPLSSISWFVFTPFAWFSFVNGSETLLKAVSTTGC